MPHLSPQFILANKYKILPELFLWAETFFDEPDEEGEKSNKAYFEVYDLATRLEEEQCTDEDYYNILFHIEQINYNEQKIPL
jgi:hypothetical protein